MVFSPQRNIIITQNATNRKAPAEDVVIGDVKDMVKIAQILEERKHTTMSPMVLLNDQLMLKKIYAKLDRLGLSAHISKIANDEIITIKDE